jgi:hypothetical protein
MTLPVRWLWLCAALLSQGCASKSESAASPEPSSTAKTSDCSTRADALAFGLSKLSSNGTRFELRELDPTIPVQSATAPGNSWRVALRDSAGNPVSGALFNVTTYMPDHGHAGPPSVGVETSEGVYGIDGLLFPMPALYAVTLSASAGDAEKQSVAIYVCVEASSG